MHRTGATAALLVHLLRLLLLSPSGLISDLPLLLLLVDGYALLDVSLELAALPRRELVQLEFEDLTTILVDHISDNFDDASLLIGGQVPDVVLEDVFLVKGHRFVGLSRLDGLRDRVIDLLDLSLHLRVVGLRSQLGSLRVGLGGLCYGLLRWQLLGLSLLGSDLGSSILLSELAYFSLRLLCFLDSITLLHRGLRLDLRRLLDLSGLCRFWDENGHLRFSRGHQLLVDNIELRHGIVKVLLKAVDLVDLSWIVGQETPVILPHLRHITSEPQSTLILALSKFVLNSVQIHELKVWLILHLLEHRVIKVGWLKELRGGTMSFQGVQNSLAGNLRLLHLLLLFEVKAFLLLILSLEFFILSLDLLAMRRGRDKGAASLVV